MNPFNSGAPSCSIEMLRARAAMLCRARAFFASRSVLEVVTPALSRAATTEPMLDSFVVMHPSSSSAEAAVGAASRWYLCTSPELMLKRLLCAGSGPIYQIATVYRAGEAGRRHNPEFSMLEWYRPGFTCEDLMQEVDDFLRAILGERVARWPTVRVAYADLFRQITGLDPLATTPEALRAVAIAQGGLQPDDRLELSLDEWLDLVMSTVIEPALSPEQITFVHSYPAAQAALARLCPEDPRVAERFEVYLGGMELANGFGELTDATLQRERFNAELALRRKIGKPAVPPDARFLDALEGGMPECAGVSIGLDRLLMVQTGASTIADVLAFAWDNI